MAQQLYVGMCVLIVISMTQRTVRIDEKLIPIIDKAVTMLRDEYDMPLFRSRAAFVERAVKEFLRKVALEAQGGA